MQLPLRLDRTNSQRLHLQLFEHIRRLILDGRLRAHMRLPASRVLAGDLGVSRNTVTAAYEMLMLEGYLTMHGPAGTFVADTALADGPTLPSAPVRDEADASGRKRRARLAFRGEAQVVLSPYESSARYDFWVGRPDPRLFPLRSWERILKRTLHAKPHRFCEYGPPAGLPRLRSVVAAHVGVARGIETDASSVVITSGIQEGLNLVARLLVQPGSEVAIENPCYQGAAHLFASYGARLLPVPVDVDGVRTARLPAEVACMYLTPSHQYPTGATLPMSRRNALLDWSERIGAYIVEDDYDNDFYYDAAPLPALKSLDRHDQVIYLGTFSKCLGPGLRLGYMILPKHLVAAAITAKTLLNTCAPWLDQALLAEFIESEGLSHHLRKLRAVCGRRRDCLVAALREQFGSAVEIAGAASGMHLIWELPKHLPDAFELESRARSHGVGVYSVKTGNALVMGKALGARYARTLLLGYAALDEGEIAEGIAALGRAARVLAGSE